MSIQVSRRFAGFIVCMLLTASACGGTTDGTQVPVPSSVIDPRCQALCEPEGKVPTDGIGDYCDSASVAQCDSLCAVRIQGATTICASCLLEKASFGNGDSLAGTSCTSMSCTLTNGHTGQTCTYQANDPSSLTTCQRKLFPATARSCSAPTFQTVTSCASVCVGGSK